MPTTIKTRRDTAANWASTNPVLADGEMGIETDIRYVKVGDGSTAYNDLPYLGAPFNYKNLLFMKRSGQPDIYLPCEEKTGTAAAAGFVGLPTGTYSGSSFALGIDGPFSSLLKKQSRAFSTTGSGVLTTPIVSIATDNVTLGCWAKVSSTSATTFAVCYGNSTSGYSILPTWTGSGGTLCALCNGLSVLTTAHTLALNVWHYLVARRLSGTWTMWSDAVNIPITGGGPTTAPNPPGGGTFYIANDNTGASPCPDGVCQVEQHSRALADEEIKAPFIGYANALS